MITDKVLVFSPYPLNPLRGGPGGFLASNYLVDKPEFVNLATSAAATSNPLRSRLNSLRWRLGHGAEARISGYYAELWRQVNFLFDQYKARQYKYIFFHDVFSLYFVLGRISKSQIVILQPHMPELPYLEMMSFGAKIDSALVKWTMDRVTPRAFSRVDSVIVPNKGSLQIYEDVLSARQRVFFVTSGATKLEAGTILNLDPSLVYFIYIGRRQKIKGFDLLIQGFRSAYEENSDIRLLVAGEGEQILDDGIIDLGATSRPGLLMASADYLLNVNRQSYFDRSIIEALSVGCPIIAACTYGHAELRGASKGIIDLGEPSAQSISAAILNAAKIKPSAELRCANIQLYNERYTPASHCISLSAALRTIMSDDASDHFSGISKDG